MRKEKSTAKIKSSLQKSGQTDLAKLTTISSKQAAKIQTNIAY
jgi:hypothetical protein